MKRNPILLSIAALLLATTLQANLLKNPEFLDDGKFWNAHQGSNVDIGDDGVVSLTAVADGRSYVQQMDAPLINGLEYIFSVEYRSDDGTTGYFYLEKADPWHGNGKKIQGADQWQTAEFRFVAQNDVGKYYAVLSTEPGENGVLQYRNPQLELVEESLGAYQTSPENILVNPAFQNDGEGWGVRDAALDYFTYDGIAMVNGYDEGRSYVIQSNLPLKTGGRYTFSVFYRGTPGTKGDFYVERGNPADCALQTVIATDYWQKATLQFIPKAEGITNYYAVLSVQQGEIGTIEFTKPVIEFQKGTLINGNFEAMDSGWEFQNATTFHHGGNYGISAELDGIYEPATIRQGGLTVQKGKIYRLAYDVRGGEDKRYTDIQGATWSHIAVLDDQGNPIPECAGWRDCFSTWQHKEVTFVAQKDMDVTLLGELKNPGVVYFDNVAFDETISELPLLEIVLDAPCSYHNGAIRGDGTAEFTGVVYPALTGTTLRLSFQGKTLEFPGNAPAAFRFPVPTQLGKAPIEALLLDEQDQKIASTTLDFTLRPPQKRSFSFDKDNVFHIDGKPVFPVMSWGSRGDMPMAEAMALHAKMGFNLVLCTHHNVDQVAENGMMAMVQLPGIFYSPKEDAEIQQHLEGAILSLQEIKDHPSLVSWFLVDEPAWRGEPVDKFRKGYRRVLEMLDDSRPIFLNEAPRGTIEGIRPFSLACDTYGCDIYPIPGPNSHSELDDKMITSVGKYTEICKQVVRGQKPLWMTLQGFAWGEFNNNTQIIYPTLEESRFMAYDSIAHGATGLVYWGLAMGSKQNDKFFEDLSTTIHEVLSVSAILIAPNDANPPKADCPEILVCKKSNAAGTLWIALNESDKEISATIPGDFPQELRVLGEDRVQKTKTGKFSDHFAPYSVHVYLDASKPLPAPLAMPTTRRMKDRVDLSYAHAFEKANWVWYPGLENTSDSQAILRVPVTLDKPLEHAWLDLAVDDGFSCTVNGKEVMRQTEWSIAWTTDIAQYLHVGENEILIHAVDMGGAPCGILFGLSLSDGREILSDGTLQCRTPDKPQWVPVKVIAPYGSGAWNYVEPYLYEAPTPIYIPFR